MKLNVNWKACYQHLELDLIRKIRPIEYFFYFLTFLLIQIEKVAYYMTSFQLMVIELQLSVLKPLDFFFLFNFFTFKKVFYSFLFYFYSNCFLEFKVCKQAELINTRLV